MIVLLDCDGVLGDFPSEALSFCNRYGRDQSTREWTLDDIKQHDILKALGCEQLQERLDQHMRDTDFCRHMPVYPGAQEFVAALSSLADVVILTSSYSDVPTWEHARRSWLLEHFGIEKRDVIFAKRKELVSGNMLIDDKFRNVDAWSSSHRDGVGVLFGRPWNTVHFSYQLRVASHAEALGAVKLHHQKVDRFKRETEVMLAPWGALRESLKESAKP